MKNTIAALLLFFFCAIASGQGKYAGVYKKMIGKTYTDSRNIPGLKGWKFMEGSLLTPIDDPVSITVDVFQKGTTYLVLFNIQEDATSGIYRVTDVLEIKPVVKGWQIETSFCRLNKTEDPWIVAWVKTANVEYMKTIKKAWRFNPDKRRIELIPVKGIDCLNEGLEQY